MSLKSFTIHNTKKNLNDTLRLEKLLKSSKFKIEDYSLTGLRRLENPTELQIVSEILNRISGSDLIFYIPSKNTRKRWTNFELSVVDIENKKDALICLIPRGGKQKDISKHDRKFCKNFTGWNTRSIERRICKKIAPEDAELKRYCNSIL